MIIAEQGNFRESLENPLVSMLVEETIDRDNTVPLDPTVPVFMETVTTFVSDTLKHPLIAARWHQGAPFNLYALNAVNKCAGCVPIAIAQVMSYYKYPEILQLTYPEATENEINLDWDSMIDHNIYHNEDCISCIQCAQLLREIGYKCNSTYNDMSTSTATNLSQIQKFGYTGNEYFDFYFQGIINSLNANCPCIIGAHGNNVGHAWVIDGYYQTTENVTTYTVTGNIKRIYRTKVTTSTYLHFNYGAQLGSTLYTLADQTILAKDGTIMGGDSVQHTVTMFDGTFTDVRRLITNIKPVNY